MTDSTPATCKVCGSPSEFVCTTPNDHGRLTRLDHHRCSTCGLVFVATPLTAGDLAEAYGSLDLERYYRETYNENMSKVRAAIAALKSLTGSNQSTRILDVGCGNGEFLQELQKHGYRTLAGHEIPGADTSRLKAAGIEIFQDMDWTSVPSAHFDVVTLLDVAEHVMDPLHLFQQCHRMLKPGGFVYFHTPVVTKLDRMMHRFAKMPVTGKLGRVWQRGRTSVFHLQNYTEKSLHIALSEAGFARLHIDQRNELSWPVTRYVRRYLCDKQNLPPILAPILTPFFYPLLATSFFNSNKGIVTAHKAA